MPVYQIFKRNQSLSRAFWYVASDGQIVNASIFSMFLSHVVRTPASPLPGGSLAAEGQGEGADLSRSEQTVGSLALRPPNGWLAMVQSEACPSCLLHFPEVVLTRTQPPSPVKAEYRRRRGFLWGTAGFRSLRGSSAENLIFRPCLELMSQLNCRSAEHVAFDVLIGHVLTRFGGQFFICSLSCCFAGRSGVQRRHTYASGESRLQSPASTLAGVVRSALMILTLVIIRKNMFEWEIAGDEFQISFYIVTFPIFFRSVFIGFDIVFKPK